MPHFQAHQKSALGPNGNVTAMLSYIITILAIVNLIIEKENNFVRFHAVQKLFFVITSLVIYFVVFFLLFIVTIIISIIGGVAASAAGDAGGIIGIILYLVMLIMWTVLPLLFIAIVLGGLIMCIVKAYQGEAFKLPIVGRFAAKVVPI